MSIYEDIDKEFQNFISDKKPKQVGLLSNGSASDNSTGYDAMEKEMAEMGYQRSNDNDSWGTVLTKIPLMAAGNTIENVGRFMTYGGKPSWMTDEEYDTLQRLSPEDRKAVDNGGLQNWVEALRMGDPEAPRPKEGAKAAGTYEINKGIMDYGQKLARENTGNYTPYTAKSFAQGVGGLLPSIAEMALMKRSGLFSPTQLQEAGATMVGAKAGQLASKIPVGAVARNADKAGLFATNLARNAILSQVEAMPESFLEQSDAVQGYIEQAKNNGTYVPGKTEQEAIEVGKKVYADNMLLNTVTDSMQNAMMDQIAMGKGSAKKKLLKNMLYNAPQGGFTEGMQGIIPKNAAGEEWHLSDPDIGEAALIGAVTGGAPGALNLGLDYASNKYAERQIAKNVRNMGEGQDGTVDNIPSEPAEMLSDDEQQIVNGIRNVNDIDGNNPPPPPGTAAAAEEMMQRNGTPSFEFTRGTRWVLNNDSVNVDNLQDITKAGVGDIATAFMEMTGQPLIITSGTDGAGALHMDGTYSHGTGYKIDVSGNGLDDPDLRHAFIEYCESKGITVLDEYEHPSPNSTGGHLDLEFHGYNGAGSVDDYSGPVNQVMPDIEAEPAASAEAGMMASDLTGQSFLEDDNGPLFADKTAKAKRDSQLENLSTEELQYMMNDEERAEYEQKAAKIAQTASASTPSGIPTNIENVMQQQRNAALDILRRRKVGTAIPVNRSNNISYPTHRQRQATAQTRNTATPYSRQSQDNLRTRVAGMDDASLTEAYRNAKDIPTRQIVVDELQKRIDNANNAARQTGAQQEAPITPMPPKQEEQQPVMAATRIARSGQGSAQQETHTYDREVGAYLVNQFADEYQGNMDGLRQEISNAKERTNREQAAGNITKGEADKRIAALNSFFFRVQGELNRRGEDNNNRAQAKPQGQAKSAQAKQAAPQVQPHQPVMQPVAQQNGLNQPTRQDVLDRAKEAGIKPDNLNSLLEAARGARNGDEEATRRFNRYQPEVKQALNDILDGNVGENRNTNAQQNKPEQVKSAQNQSEERRSDNGNTQLQKPETGENRNQDQHAESGQVEQKKDADSKTAEKQSENVKQEEPKPKKAEPPANETREEKAERLINEAFTDEDELDMAMSCFFDNMENPLQALREKRKALQEQFDELVQNAYNALARTLPKDKNGKPTGAGVNLVRKSDDSGYIRESQNPLWYQNDYKNGEKTPYSKKNMMNTAMEMVLGERKDMSDQDALAEYDASNRELRPMFEENQRLHDNIETLDAIEPKMQEIQQELDKGKNVTKTAENKKAPAKAEDKKRVRPYRNENGEWVTSKGERIQLAEGYKTESGKDINNADSIDFIVKPDGTKEFGKITDAISKEVKEKYGEDLEPGNIRLRVGNANEGLIHAKEHEKQAKDAGYSSIEDLISDVASNFTEIYKRTNKDGRITYNLVKTGDKSKNIMNGIAPVYFELQKDEAGNYYIVITALPKGDKSLEREIKNEHLIYRSPGLDAATVSNDGAVSTQGNSNVGVTQGSFPTSDSSVPTDTIPQNQQERKGEGKESAADNYQQAVEWMQKNNGGSVTGLRLALNISREDAVNLINRMTKDGIISDGDIDERRDYLGNEKAESEKSEAAPSELKEIMDKGEPEAENLIQPEEVPETMRKNSTAPQSKIEDFGQKIGGARKDMYVNLEPGEKTARPKSEKKADDGLKDRPWLRDYDIKQGEDGKWILTHKPSEEARKRATTVSSWISGIYGQIKKRPVETKTYDTREEAEHHAAIDALSEKHRVFKCSNGEFEISRRIGGQKDYHWFALKTGFKTEKEALTYMALHPVEVLQIRTSFGEADLPKPNLKGWNDARTGKAPQRLKADQNATADMFTNTFGFRGVQFGNWENQIERQSVMNAAYEGLLDLADIIGVDPKIISLNGELGLAFGARGQGLSGAVAHYEPRYTIINLTKMKGAGALAHEWLHALDHYLMIKGGIISNKRRADGLLLAKNFNEHASDSDFQLKSSNLSDALKQAFLKVKNTAFYKEVIETKDETDALKWEQQARDRLDKELSDIRNYLAKERKYSSKKKPATEEQLKRFDELATKLAAADEKREWDGNYMMHVYPTMRKLSDLFKEVTGRGLLKKNPGDDFKRLNYAISNLIVRRETLADAQAKTEFTKLVPSEYSRNNTTIDRGRSTEYWTKPTEMLARAFSSFVEDSAAAKGYTTDFLSYGSDNRLLLFGKPFPEGEERKAINQAFREFFKVVQTEIEHTKKETGEIKFSVRAAAKEQAADNTRYQAAYHGSPHVFDTFSLAHVGSGEGAQLHGWGLYFALDEKVAQSYRDHLSTPSVTINGDRYIRDENEWYLDSDDNDVSYELSSPEGKALEVLQYANWDKAKALDIMRKFFADRKDSIAFLENNDIEKAKSGSVFEVDIPENDVLLDEQKKLKDQPKDVAASIKKLHDDIKEKGNFRFSDKESLLETLENPESTGKDIYALLAVSLRNDILASKLLNKYGIKGIAYNGGKDGRCFVVFDDKAIQIMQRYEAAVRANAAEVRRSVDSIISEVKDAYPGAKDLKVDGNKITFTMPNGVNLTVNIKDQIILNAKDEAKARMSHRLTDENTGIVVEGYVRKLDNESMMVLSQESSEGTAYHEAFHTVRDWCLTEKENADLEKYYGKKAKEQGIDVEEAIADGYRDWKLARAKGKGTLFGKLYKKIMDFIDTAKAIFKGMYDVHKIYEKIESGDIWNRDAQGRFTKISNTENNNFKPASVIMEEAKELYNTAAKKFSSITDKVVSERVKEAIQQTLDFGEGFGEILERASGKSIQQSLFSEENAEQANDVRGNTGRIPHQRNSKEIGFSLTRDLINNGFADLTGKPVKDVKQLAEIAQVLRHPGYEKMHYVYVRNGNVTFHETTTAMLPNVSNVMLEGEDPASFGKRLNNNLIQSGADTVYLIHNHPSGNITPSQEDKNYTQFHANALRKSPIKFGGHVILDTTECSIISGNGRVYTHNIPEKAQIHYADNPDKPHILLNKQIDSANALMDISKKLADQSTTTVFFADNRNVIRSIVQLPEEFTKMKLDRMNRYLRWLTRRSYARCAFIVTGDRNAYAAMRPLFHQGDSVVDIVLTGARQTAGQAYNRANAYEGYKFFGIDGNTKLATKVLEPTTEYETAGTREGASLMPGDENDVRYSIREKVNNAVNPPPVQYGSNDTEFGRVTQHIGGRQNENLVQKGLKAWRNLYKHLVDEDTHAHKVDEAIEERTGKKLDDNDSFYNNVRMAGNIAKGHAEWLIAGDEKHGETVKSRIKNETLKKQFNAKATLQNVIDTVADKVMNSKYGDFLEKHKMRDWTQVLETHLAAWRLKEMYNLHLENWRAEHEAWRKRREDALSRGETFREREPVYKPYKLPGNLTIQDINAAIKAAPPEVEQAAQLFYAFNKNNMILLADAGLISEENYQAMNAKYKRYCPLMRDFSDTAAADQFITSLSKGGDSVANVSNPLKRISEEGSNRNLLSPLASAIKATAVYCDRAERNKVGQMAVELAEKHKLDDLIWRVPGSAADAKNCIFTVMKDGKKQAYQCLQELYEPIVGYNEDASNMVLNAMAIPARMLRLGATISPTFAIRNMIRDTFFAGIASKNGFVPVWDTIRGGMALRNNPELRAQFEAMGVGMYTFYGNEINAGKKLGDLKFKDPETLFDYVKGIIKNPFTGTYKALEDFSSFSEQATRMGEFQRAIKNGKSLEEAARDARNLTIDFSRHGSLGKHVNRIIPFFNACVQGTDMMVRLLHKDFPGTMMKLTKYIILPSIALWAMNRDKDWWKELDPEMKNSAWFFETPQGIVRMPKPQEAGILFGSGVEAILDQATKRDPDAMKNWAKAFLDAIKPNVVPTVFLPLLENTANFSYFRMSPIVSRRNETLPGEQQYSNGTSELSKMLGASAVAHAYNKGGYSPSKIDNFIRGYTGTMGMILWQAAGEGARKAQGKENNSPAKNWQEMPFAREFFANDYNMNRSLNEFYEMATAAQAQHNGYGRKGHPTAAVQAVTKARNKIADERKEIQKITDSKRITPERKQELIKMKRDKINRIATATLNRYRDKF